MFCYDRRNGNLLFAANGDPTSAMNWSTEIADAIGDVGAHVSMTTLPIRSADGKVLGAAPLAVYQDVGSGDTRLAFRQAGTWQVVNIASEGLTGFDTSIDAVGSGYVLVGYRRFDVASFTSSFSIQRLLPFGE
ncbi:MAG: hypothetical protein D6800_03735 [Candidatus Zixiibacteriota bacterium]|nr:MAG: hypothetical protein D6800_03735 [candidate division Zixibacteria bacterium]